jgi:hypothetical protein
VNPQQEAVALWLFFEERRIKPKVATIVRILRNEYRLKFRDGDVSKWLSKFSGRGPAESTRAQEHKTPRPERTGHATREKEVSLPSSPSSSGSIEPSEPPRLFEPPPANVTPLRRRRSKPTDVGWRKPLIEAANELLDRPMCSWSIAERFTWARWHCLTFGNCTADEGRNRARATATASGLATMALSDDYGDLTGRQYFQLARIIHVQRNEKPWFDPWFIKGALNVAAAREA